MSKEQRFQAMDAIQSLFYEVEYDHEAMAFLRGLVDPISDDDILEWALRRDEHEPEIFIESMMRFRDGRGQP